MTPLNAVSQSSSRLLVGMIGFEPMIFALSERCTGPDCTTFHYLALRSANRTSVYTLICYRVAAMTARFELAFSSVTSLRVRPTALRHHRFVVSLHPHDGWHIILV